jgi:hypothetical protein
MPKASNTISRISRRRLPSLSLMRACSTRRRRLWMMPRHPSRIAAEHPRLHARGVDHVVGHQQDVVALHPLAVLRHRRCQLGDGPGLRVALQQQVQHRHEMRLAAAEAAVRVGALVAGLSPAWALADGALDEA